MFTLRSVKAPSGLTMVDPQPVSSSTMGGRKSPLDDSAPFQLDFFAANVGLGSDVMV